MSAVLGVSFSNVPSLLIKRSNAVGWSKRLENTGCNPFITAEESKFFVNVSTLNAVEAGGFLSVISIFF